MTLAQLILLAFIAFLGAFYFSRARGAGLDRLIFSLLFAFMAMLVLFPDLTTTVANAVGIGRGVDLLLYLFSLFVIFCFIAIYLRLRDLQRELTQIVRLLAIQNAHVPGDEPHVVDGPTPPKIEP